MKASIALSLGVLVCGLATMAAGCDDVSGGCDGKIDGDLYALRLFNCTTGTMTVHVNDRVVGSVRPMDENGTCGVNDFGTFPQCSTGKVEAFSTNSVTETLWWNEDAVNLNPDGCWLVATIVDATTDTSHLQMPSVDPIDGPECQYLEKETF